MKLEKEQFPNRDKEEEQKNTETIQLAKYWKKKEKIGHRRNKWMWIIKMVWADVLNGWEQISKS